MQETIDEMVLIRDATLAFSKAETVTALAGAWLRYVEPCEDELEPKIFALLLKAYELRISAFKSWCPDDD